MLCQDTRILETEYWLLLAHASTLSRCSKQEVIGLCLVWMARKSRGLLEGPLPVPQPILACLRTPLIHRQTMKEPESNKYDVLAVFSSLTLESSSSMYLTSSTVHRSFVVVPNVTHLPHVVALSENVLCVSFMCFTSLGGSVPLVFFSFVHFHFFPFSLRRRKRSMSISLPLTAASLC